MGKMKEGFKEETSNKLATNLNDQYSIKQI